MNLRVFIGFFFFTIGKKKKTLLMPRNNCFGFSTEHVAFISGVA